MSISLCVFNTAVGLFIFACIMLIVLEWLDDYFNDEGEDE